jgi:hypothetical protein
VHKTVLNIPIPNGKQYIELNGNTFGKIHQDVTVVPNKNLTLSFKYRGRTTANESIRVTILDPITNTNIHTFNATATFDVWNEVSASYTTSSTQTRVRVRFEALTGQSAGAGNLIDDVVFNYSECSETNVQIVGENTVCNNEVVLSLAHQNNIASYLWSNGSTNPVIVVNQAGTYSVTVTLTNGTVITSPNFVLSNCIASRTIVTENTIKEEVFEVVLYPNPTVDEFSIKFVSDSNEPIEINIVDMLGKNIEQRTILNDNINSVLLGSSLPTGIYNVIIKQGENVTKHRLIKK